MSEENPQESEKKPEPFTPPAGKKIELREDTGSRALSEALVSVFGVLKLIMAGVIIFFVLSGVFTVQPNEVAVVLRFGKPVGQGKEAIRKPGLQFAFPYPIDEIVRIPTGTSRTLHSDTGWYFETEQEVASGRPPTARNSLRPGVDGYLLAADGNIVHARSMLKYRVIDPVQFVFYFRQGDYQLLQLLNRSLIHAAAEFTSDAAIYKDKIAFKESVRKHLMESLSEPRMGIQIEALDIQTSPPIKVKAAFDNVIAAEQTRSETILKAEADARAALQEATGEAKSIIAGGMIQSNQLVMVIEAEARAFEAQLPYYRKDSDLFVRRITAETMHSVMTNAQDKFFVPLRPDGSSRTLHLKLSKEPPKPKRI